VKCFEIGAEGLEFSFKLSAAEGDKNAAMPQNPACLRGKTKNQQKKTGFSADLCLTFLCTLVKMNCYMQK
jgi:hypothetical protein